MAQFFSNVSFNTEIVSFVYKEDFYFQDEHEIEGENGDYTFVDEYLQSKFELYTFVYSHFSLIPEDVDFSGALPIDDFVFYASDTYQNSLVSWSEDSISFAEIYIDDVYTNGFATSGVLNGLGKFFENGDDTEYYWLISDVSGSMVSLENVVATSTVDDDTLFFISLLGGNDEIYLSQFDDVFDAGAGDDVIYGFGGNDTLDGGAGYGDVVVFRGAFTEYLISYDLASQTYTIEDTVSGRDGTDTVSGIEIFSFSNNLYTALQLQSLAIDTSAPTVSAFNPTDGAKGVAVGSNIVVTFSETIARGTGTIELRSGSATGTIVETFNAATSTRLTLSGNQLTIDPTSNLSNSTQYFVVMASGTIRDIAGNNYIGTSTYDFTTALVSATAGNDTISGTWSDDTINGLAGNDTLIGGAGNDTLDGGVGNDALTGGDGTDTASYATATAGVTVSLALTTAQNTVGAGGDTLATIENLTGSGLSDVLTGNATANRILGASGNDMITGGGGIDVLDGGEGSDVYLVTLLSDKTAAEITDTGTSGTDELRFAATTVGTITLLAGDTGLESVVIGTGTGSSAVFTAKTALNVDATWSANGLTITGNAGNNTLTGSSFADTLTGGAGHDVLLGGLGNDVLIGGLGQDTLSGDIGNDTFKFSMISDTGTPATKPDVITDFVQGEDVIDLSDLDAFAATKTVNDTFVWQGTAAFSSATQGEVRYKKFDFSGTANDYTIIWIDDDKDIGVERHIRLTGLYDLTASDFVL